MVGRAMDWNKTNTVLIVAFIILNIFLYSSSYNNIFSEEYEVSSDSDFISNVEEILKEKNIFISCDLPDETYMLPTLDTEYELIHISTELLNRFLGPGIEPVDGVAIYENNSGEILEIKDEKKLIYTSREKESGAEIAQAELAEHINDFLQDKDINRDGYSKNYNQYYNGVFIVVYTKKHNNFSMDNSYMKFYLDKEGIYKFEMQNIAAATETAEKIRTFSAAEALPRLLSFEEIKNNEIIQIEMTYYSVEDENWQFISRINSYPVWKVIFRDGTQKHLSSINTYSVD